MGEARATGVRRGLGVGEVRCDEHAPYAMNTREIRDEYVQHAANTRTVHDEDMHNT